MALTAYSAQTLTLKRGSLPDTFFLDGQGGQEARWYSQALAEQEVEQRGAELKETQVRS